MRTLSTTSREETARLLQPQDDLELTASEHSLQPACIGGGTQAAADRGLVDRDAETAPLLLNANSPCTIGHECLLRIRLVADRDVGM